MSDRPKISFNEWLRRADRRGHVASIVEVLQKRLLRFPNDGSLHHQLGITLRQSRQYSKSLHHLAKAWRTTPVRWRPSLSNSIATTYERMRNEERAIRWHNRAIIGNARDATWVILFASMYSRDGRLSEAARLLHRATRCEDGAIDEAYLNLGMIYRAQRRYAEAEASLKTALSITPDYPEARRILRDVQYAMKILR